jgi:DNA polymerase elongation subunit (family B)
MEQVFRLFDFNVFNDKSDDNEGSDDGEYIAKKDNANFMIQMFGINEEGKTCSILVEEYKPFFYVKVADNWTINLKNSFLAHLKQKVGAYYADSIIEAKLIQRKKLYGFDGGKEHKFVMLRFNNINAFNKVAKMWFKVGTDEEGNYEKKLLPKGYLYADTYTEIYESNIPPLLRFFHIKEVSPSGWVSLPQGKYIEITRENKTTTCDFEFITSYKNIEPLNNKETRVPYKIMSFDIEASSSHGDFPVPVKSYKKLATNIADYFIKQLNNEELSEQEVAATLKSIMYNAFGFETNLRDHIDLVYPKKKPQTKAELDSMIDKWLQTKVRDYKNGINDAANNEHSIEAMFEAMGKEMASKVVADDEDGDGDDENNNDNNIDESNITFNPYKVGLKVEEYKNKASTIINIVNDTKFERNGKINELIISLKKSFPPLEGDKVTFIGSTFVKYGEPEPYLNHCIALNSCDNVNNSVIESYNTEKEVLLAWTDLVQRENPDIIIGYNIFSFDYEFLFRRALELDCIEDFMKLSRNKDKLCVNKDYKTGAYEIEKSSITLASGTYDLSMINMTGRFQIDMYNWFRKTENLTSYKLDYVGGHFIGDVVKSLEHIDLQDGSTITKVKTNNMTGLQAESYIHFEEINHSSDYYAGGKKIRVKSVNRAEGYFEVYGKETPKAKTVKWGLAKDDVSPKDIFRMTNEGPSARAVIAKYCIQDCNLVHHLFNKVDVVTDLVEMSKLCSVPMSFLVFRGQGIKLTSYVAKKCREKGTLMPVINKGSKDDGYEGAIVLEPKCGLYLDNPISVGDFASLYPSSMLSENLCPSSKVWTKIYDLAGNLVSETGEKDWEDDTQYLYDNLPTYEYVDVKFDTYRYVRKTPKGAAEKVKSGYKVCRFAQPLLDKDGKEQKAIMPSILQELLKARKDTRKQIPQTNDEFMKNVLDKRQLAYKVTANSLYGQLGAKTSTFYEPDIAASTTATGRLLLTYAKRVVEECYGDAEVETKYGIVKTRAEYVYGDTDSVFFTFNLANKETGEKIVGEKALELSIEIAQTACHMVSSFLKAPHDFEYEKTFMPFCLLSKKRYVGMKYEFDPKKGKRNEMGIVLKRRDNAPIVKDVYGGIIDILMKDQNLQKAIDYLNSCLQDLVDGNVPIEKLIITKSLNGFYKNPQQIAHKVLADRITARDPGNKPSSGDRIPFVYIVNPNKKALQGEKIETPIFIKDNNLKIDYSFYITNQIMKPLLQLFGLVLEDIWKMQGKESKVSKFKREVADLKKEYANDDEKFQDKLTKMKDKEVKALLFDKYLRETNNAKSGNQAITGFFKRSG